MPDTGIDLSRAVLPNMCGCGHDQAYHNLAPEINTEGQVIRWVAAACTWCLCKMYDPNGRPAPGTGQNAAKEWSGHLG